MPDVKCGVSNCKFWEQGNKCIANAIVIDVDQHAKNMDTEFAQEFSSNSQHKANVSSSTCCNTFQPKK